MVSNPSDFVGVSREFELIGFYCIHSLKSDDLKAINCGCELNQCDLTFFQPLIMSTDLRNIAPWAKEILQNG